MPQHRQQLTPWACQYTAMFCLFEDARFLMPEHVDTNPYWFHRLCRQYGYDVEARYVDQTFSATAPLSFWHHYLQGCHGWPEGYGRLLLLDVGTGKLAHTVGVVVGPQRPATIQFTVYDPLKPTAMTYQMGGFLESIYGRAYAVYEVASREHYELIQPHLPGFDLPNVSPAQREAFLAEHHDYFVSLTRHE